MEKDKSKPLGKTPVKRITSYNLFDYDVDPEEIVLNTESEQKEPYSLDSNKTLSGIFKPKKIDRKILPTDKSFSESEEEANLESQFGPKNILKSEPNLNFDKSSDNIHLLTKSTKDEEDYKTPKKTTPKNIPGPIKFSTQGIKALPQSKEQTPTFGGFVKRTGMGGLRVLSLPVTTSFIALCGLCGIIFFLLSMPIGVILRETGFFKGIPKELESGEWIEKLGKVVKGVADWQFFGLAKDIKYDLDYLTNLTKGGVDDAFLVKEITLEKQHNQNTSEQQNMSSEIELATIKGVQPIQAINLKNVEKVKEKT